MKIFGIGFIKTGTSSLGVALKLLGYNHCGGSFNSANQLMPAYIQGNHQQLYDFVDRYDSFEDFPFCAPGVPQLLDKKYPNSKFVLTERPSESWYRSLTKYFDLPGPNKDRTLFTVTKTGSDLPLGRFYGLMNYMMCVFGTLDMSDKDFVIKTYEEHNQRFKDYFANRPGKLLVVNWVNGDGWKQLCPFLGKPVPNRPFPRVNANVNNKIK